MHVGGAARFLDDPTKPPIEQSQAPSNGQPCGRTNACTAVADKF